MTAFFSSRALREIAPGLSRFLHHSQGKIRLIISPLLSSDDKKAIKEGIESTPEVLERRFDELINESLFSEKTITEHTLKCLAYLISTQRLEMKLAYVRGGHLFHAKVSIINDEYDILVIHGSTNFTSKGLSKNFEHARLERTWEKSTERSAVYEFVKTFENTWSNNDKNLKVFTITDGLKNNLISNWSTRKPPLLEDINNGLSEDDDKKSEIEINQKFEPKHCFIVPDYLDCWSGEYKHQGEAIDRWLKNNYRGTFEMCTGSGKTIAALVAANELYKLKNNLLIYISVPYKPLLNQWVKECKKFDLLTLGLVNLTRAKKIDKINEVVRRLNFGNSSVEVIVGTEDALKDDEYMEILMRANCEKMLIGDEVHHLGTKNFLESPPEFFENRLGLSATFERQYDDEGTKGLINFFGKVVYKYDLVDAIGNCLVEYNYHVYPVFLTDEEIFKWINLTEKLRKIGWMEDKDDTDNKIIEALIRKRRLVVEQATNKLPAFKNRFQNNNLKKLKHTLVYASDKGGSQLADINYFLKEDCKIMFHQVTYEETSTGISVDILDRFASGNSLKVLTAMRVLDEGINIPEISTAYILASTTVKRQWTQRRGRVLRKCQRINKTKAEIHDFVVVAPKEEIFNSLQKYEFDRIKEFSSLSLNPLSETGGLTFLQQYRN
jgi:superfamily II DNA or RNA helicase